MQPINTYKTSGIVKFLMSVHLNHSIVRVLYLSKKQYERKKNIYI